MKPDLAKVREAVAAIELRQAATRAREFRTLPLPPSPVAADAAIRKPLKAHGVKCPGFGYYHFHQTP